MKALLEEIIWKAIKQQASDIHLILQNQQFNIYYRIHGELILYKQLDRDYGKRLTNLIKFQAKMDLNYLKQPKTGQFEITIESVIYYLRVSNIPSKEGDNLVVRILNQQQKLGINDLTSQQLAIEYLYKLTTLKAGLVIICGPTGEGKSTSLHALLNEIYHHKPVNIITIEDPIEIEEPNFIQIQVQFKQGFNFEVALKQILRHDPDVVMIGEIRDEASAALALRCAFSGCLVFTTLHASSSHGALFRLKNLGLKEIDLKEVLQAVLSQRLIYPSNKKPFAIFEWMDKPILQKYFNCQEGEYLKFEDRIKESIERKESEVEDYQKSEFKKI